MAPAKPKKIGIIFGYGLGSKSGTFRKDSGYGGGPELEMFGKSKPRATGISGALLNIEVGYNLARNEFFHFCGDLWIAIVRNSVWHPKAPGPSPLGMIYTRVSSDGIDFGWRNYPSKTNKSEHAPRPEDLARARFDLRADIFERITRETGTKWFTVGARGDKTTRSTIAEARIQAALRAVMTMRAPGGQEMPFQVPIRSGQRKGMAAFAEFLHPNAKRASDRREANIAKAIHKRTGRRPANWQD